MISAAMIEGLLNSGFSKDLIRKIIENDYYTRENVLREEMQDAMMSLSTQCNVRKITESLKKERE